VSSGPSNLRAYAAFGAAALALATAGCGGGERRDADAGDGPYTVDVARAQFPQRQHVGARTTLAVTVRNTGEDTIPALAVTVHGFSERSGDAAQADARSAVWLVDEEPPGATTAIEDTWATGALAPGRATTLRWQVTPVLAGTHKLDYAIAGDLAGGAETRVAGGGRPRGSLTVRVDAKPAQARVDPRTGAVIRE
jgi:hypothetical protein